MNVLQFPSRRPGPFVYQPAPRREVLRQLLGGLARGIASAVCLVVAVVLIVIVIVGGQP